MWRERTVRVHIQKLIIQFFIIYVPSQQPKGQLRTQHTLDTVITLYTNQNYRQALVEENNNNNNNK
jgi:hypothetical protein